MNGLFDAEEKTSLCPCLCGGQAYITGMFIPVDGGEINSYSVGCEKCGISFQQDWDYGDIVEKWNKRYYDSQK